MFEGDNRKLFDQVGNVVGSRRPLFSPHGASPFVGDEKLALPCKPSCELVHTSAFRALSIVPKTVMTAAQAAIGMNAVQGNPVRSQQAPQRTGTITAMV